ncbi:hypothetical protein FZC78_01560 [Rossellomorea vietnamensis]|uniref:Uncharacterized protein n=1 Tax=Rossellomorea vietnamensis TaxID=218284 RepID=A0A5D4NZR9_9BACI|nr:hypothetical protein [Rossellomorea vietnamensis]TYS19743.1 hypothetical protein FZC78_01560 [Rossellomorea vietnamensis]
MDENNYEKKHLKKLVAFSYVTFASLFSLIFLMISIFILFFSMTGILDFLYIPSQIAITSFIISIIFSVLALRESFGKILLVFNVFLMLFMIIYGP